MNGTMAIVGTAGRRDDAERLSRDAYSRMYSAAMDAASEWGVTAGVSGGAAWADHLAVRAFLEGRFVRLRLHFPVAFAGRSFLERGDGVTANRYHRAFSETCGFDSLAQIADAVAKGAETVVGSGFKSRNLAIGREATHMVAFTFGAARDLSGDFRPSDPGYADRAVAGLKDGGTAHCWANAAGPAVKRHIDLGLLLRPGPGPVDSGDARWGMK